MILSREIQGRNLSTSILKPMLRHQIHGFNTIPYLVHQILDQEVQAVV